MVKHVVSVHTRKSSFLMHMYLDNTLDDGIVDETEIPLETIDLDSKAQQQQEPVLEFHQPPVESEQETDLPVADGSPPLAGTELRGRQRTRSGGVNFKDWSSHQLKITKQMVQERFGSGVRTVDTDLEKRIENLRETQKKYSQLMSLTQQYRANFQNVVETQKSMAEHFAFMSIRAPELTSQFHYNAETQKVISRNGETLLAAVKHFTSNMQTVCSKTMEDTLQTVKVYESARLSYDAYRTEYENQCKQAATSQKASNSLATTGAEFEKHKKKFEQLRQDVDIKLKLLDENKVCSYMVYCFCHQNIESLTHVHSFYMFTAQGGPQATDTPPRSFCCLLFLQS